MATGTKLQQVSRAINWLRTHRLQNIHPITLPREVCSTLTYDRLKEYNKLVDSLRRDLRIDYEVYKARVLKERESERKKLLDANE